MFLRFLLLILPLVSGPSWASEATFSLSNRKVGLEIPEGWKAETGLLGLPLVLLGPLGEDKTRTVLSFAGMGKDNIAFGDSFVSRAQPEFKRAKSEWLKKERASLVDFLPMEDAAWPNGRALILGMRYEFRGRRNTEKTYYFLCKQKMYHAKVMTSAANEHELSTAEALIKGLSCE